MDISQSRRVVSSHLGGFLFARHYGIKIELLLYMIPFAFFSFLSLRIYFGTVLGITISKFISGIVIHKKTSYYIDTENSEISKYNSNKMDFCFKFSDINNISIVRYGKDTCILYFYTENISENFVISDISKNWFTLNSMILRYYSKISFDGISINKAKEIIREIERTRSQGP